jgi:Mn2+/Fe2+ NRAMP family transporter
LGETLSWHIGLARLPLRAKALYATIAVGMALGVALNFSAIDPIRALYWSAVLNGVVAVPVIVMMLRLIMRRSIIAGFTLPLPLQVTGRLATAAMAVTVVAMIASWLEYQPHAAAHPECHLIRLPIRPCRVVRHIMSGFHTQGL